MFTFTIELGKLTDWLGLGVNLLIFGSGLFVLWTGVRSLRALIRQLQSQATQQAYEAHKTLYMPLVQDPALAKMIWGPSADEYRVALLSSMLINHAGRVFSEIKNGNISHTPMDAFKGDLADLLSWPVVRERWSQVRPFHHPEFVALGDECVRETSIVELAKPTASSSPKRRNPSN